MPTMTDELLEQQRKAWNQFAPGWKKWDAFMMEKLRPVGEVLLETVQLKKGGRVLDAATGTGEPGLTAATRIGSDGEVIGFDVAEAMVEIANANAKRREIQNYLAIVSDGATLPQPSDYFDAIVCRFGIIFFPDPLVSLRELRRVLKSEGIAAFSAWGPPSKNPWATAIAGIVNKMLNLPIPPQDAPGIFRFPEAGSLSSLLKQVGFKEVQEKEITGEMSYESPEQYWQMMTEVAAPIAMALGKTDPEMREKIRNSVLETVQSKMVEGRLSLPWSAWIVSGVK